MQMGWGIVDPAPRNGPTERARKRGSVLRARNRARSRSRSVCAWRRFRMLRLCLCVVSAAQTEQCQRERSDGECAGWSVHGSGCCEGPVSGHPTVRTDESRGLEVSAPWSCEFTSKAMARQRAESFDRLDERQQVMSCVCSRRSSCDDRGRRSGVDCSETTPTCSIPARSGKVSRKTMSPGCQSA